MPLSFLIAYLMDTLAHSRTVALITVTDGIIGATGISGLRWHVWTCLASCNMSYYHMLMNHDMNIYIVALFIELAGKVLTRPCFRRNSLLASRVGKISRDCLQG